MNKIARMAVLGALGVSLAGVGLADAEEKGAKGEKGKSPLATAEVACPMDDAAKVKTALQFLHGNNQSEIAQAKMALEKAKSPQVKQYAQMLLDDHQKADKKLTDLAQKKGFELEAKKSQDPINASVAELSSKLRKQLSGKSGAEFDVAFIAPQTAGHALAMGVIEQAGNAAQDAEVKSYLDDTKKALSKHRDHAMKLQGALQLRGTGVGGGPQQEEPKQEEPKQEEPKQDVPQQE